MTVLTLAACLLLAPFVGGLAVIVYEWWGITRLPEVTA